MSEHFWNLSFAKFAPRLRARAIWKSKLLKHRGFGTFFEVEFRKIYTTPARESDLEVKTVKIPGARNDFEILQNTWQAQEFVRVAKTLAGVVNLKRLGNDAFRVASARISCFAMSMFEASDAESVERLQISYHGSVILQGSFRVANAGVRMPRLRFFVAGVIFLKHPLKNG